MMRDILIGAVVIAVIIILLRLIFGSPLVQRISESFANPSLVNKTTECPKGSQFYMYEGGAYCCSGTVSTTADSVGKTCRPATGRDATTVFCSLGPSTTAAKNCLELRSGLMQAEANTFCPSATPTFVKPDGSSGSSGTAGRCCGAPGGNSGLTDCASGAASCEVAADPDPFKNPASCQFKKAQEDDGTCPAGYGPFTAARGPITIYGCTNTATNCYKQATINRLRSFGHDVTGLVVCA